MPVGGLGGDAERPGDLLGLVPARQESYYLNLSVGEPSWPLETRLGVAGRLDDRGHGVGVEPDKENSDLTSMFTVPGAGLEPARP
ncbi:MAG: hypothetical protein ABIW46_06830 [Acidimicrobiales bacterium]